MLDSNMIVCWTIKDKVLLVLHTSRRIAIQATSIHINILNPTICVYLKTMTACSDQNLLISLLFDAHLIVER